MHQLSTTVNPIVEVGAIMNDLFGDSPRREMKGGYAGRPGEGPEGETCGTCRYSYKVGNMLRFYWKCGHPAAPEATRGAATDIRRRAPACQHWNPRKSR